MIYQHLVIIAGFILMYSLLAKPIEKSVLSGALLATLFGLLVGPLCLGIYNIELKDLDYRLIAELALALVLFSDASKTKMRSLSKDSLLPKRLLGIGLPLTILAGTVVAYLMFPDFSILEMGILATLLAPTDAALGKAVVTNPAVPIKIREGLNVESGLNDGICVPVLFLLLGLHQAEMGHTSEHATGVLLFVEEIGVGLAVGVSLTYLAHKLLVVANKKEWLLESWKPIVLIALAFSCFGLAQILDGSGFIACFTGGLFYGWLNKNRDSILLESTEGFGDTISMITWVIFGSAVLYETLAAFTWQVVIYALLSLTVIRMIPVFISLIGHRFNFKEKLFVSWFGPRGLASIVFAIIILEADLPHEETIVLTAVSTILLSIVLHGITAKPFIKALAIAEKAKA